MERGGRNKRRGRGYNNSGSPRGRGESPAGQSVRGSGSPSPSKPVTPRPKEEKMETPEVKSPPSEPTTPQGKVETPEVKSPPSQPSTPQGNVETPEVKSPPSQPSTPQEKVETPEVKTPPSGPSTPPPQQVPITHPETATPDPEFVTPVSSPTDLASNEEEKLSPIEEIQPPQPVTAEVEVIPVKAEPSRNENPTSQQDSSLLSSGLSDPDDALPDLESVESIRKTTATPAKVTQAAVGAADNRESSSKPKEPKKEEKQTSSSEEEKIEPFMVSQELSGKPGYMGGTAGLGGQIKDQTGGDGYESDDSLLTPSRRPSTSTEGAGWMGFSRRQVLTLLVFSLADFFSAIIISLQAPFYPQEAEAKGATATEYGLVFGVFELVVFLTSPIYGKYLHKLGPKHVFNTGICVTGLATIFFGFLDQFEDRTTFITMCFVVRIIEALGDAAFITASFAIIAAEFPDSVATTFASLETFFGLGLIVGPTLGGALYQKGGFTLPFAVMGGLLLVVGILTFLLMPKSKPVEDDGGKHSPGGILAILKVPGVSLAAVSIITGSITIGFLNSTLEPHIRQFQLSPILTGLVFIINGGLYAVTAPAWGWLCDRAVQPIYAALVGGVTVLIGFLLIGPAPFIPMETVLWLTCVGLMVHGIGLGATLVAAFVMALRESINHGFADNIHTYGLTSALWTSSFALGSFVGPSIGGILLDEVGFRWATVFVLGVQVVLMILILGYLAKTRGGSAKFGKDNLSEHAPLLGSISEDPCTSKTAIARQGGSNNGGGYGSTGGSLA